MVVPYNTFSGCVGHCLPSTGRCRRKIRGIIIAIMLTVCYDKQGNNRKRGAANASYLDELQYPALYELCNP